MYVILHFNATASVNIEHTVQLTPNTTDKKLSCQLTDAQDKLLVLIHASINEILKYLLFSINDCFAYIALFPPGMCSRQADCCLEV